MSALQRKIRNFLDLRRDLESQYKALIDSTGDPSSGLQDLYEFDQLCYSYHALKSYYDVSRSNWDSDYRNLLDDLASIVSRMEEKIPVAEILAQAPQLNVVRRQLRENAREGGKVAFSMVSSNADMDSFQRIVMSLDLDDAQVKSKPLRQSPHGNATQETQSQKKTSPQEKQKPPAPQPPKVAPASTPSSSAKEGHPSQGALPPVQRPSQTQPQGVFPRAAAPSTAAKETPQTSHASNINNTQKQQSTLANTTSYSSGKREAPQQPTASFGQSPKRPKQVFFTHLNDWTPEHVQCIFRCAIMAPHRVSESIQEGFQKAFGINISLEAAHALQSHYGILPETMNDYKYYMQSFHTVASKFFANRQHYVTEPWAELKKQFMRKTNLELSDSDVKGRYELYVLHRQTYGPSGEPPSSYEGPWREFNRIYTFRKHHARDPGKSFFASANEHGETPQNVPQPRQLPSIKLHEWPMAVVKELIRAKATSAISPARIQDLQKTLIDSGFDYSRDEIISGLSHPSVNLWAKDYQERLATIRNREAVAHQALGQSARVNWAKVSQNNHTPQMQSLPATQSHGNPAFSSPTNVTNGTHKEAPVSIPSQPRPVPSQPRPVPSQPIPNKEAPVSIPSQPRPVPSQPGPVPSQPGPVPNQPIPNKEAPVSIPSQPKPVPTQPISNTPQPEKQTVGSAAGSPSSDSDLPKGVRRVSAKVGSKPNHFDNLIGKVADAVRPNWHYLNRFKNLPVTAFWDFQKNLTITSTVDHISNIPENTQNPTERVARANLIKLLMLRFLRKHSIIVTEEFLEARLIKMMERDVFDPAACQLINDQIMKK